MRGWVHAGMGHARMSACVNTHALSLRSPKAEAKTRTWVQVLYLDGQGGQVRGRSPAEGPRPCGQSRSLGAPHLHGSPSTSGVPALPWPPQTAALMQGLGQSPAWGWALDTRGQHTPGDDACPPKRACCCPKREEGPRAHQHSPRIPISEFSTKQRGDRMEWEAAGSPERDSFIS